MTTSSNPFQIKKLKLPSNLEIAYIDEGKGKVLLFVHGLATYSLSWKKNIEYLKNHYRCIAIDLPGNGHSSHGEYPYGISFFASAVYEFIQQMKLKDVCLVGHSMGAQSLLRLVINQPDAATQLVLCAPAGFETFTPFEITVYHSTIRFFDFFSTEEHSLRSVLKNSFHNFPLQADEMISELVELLKQYPVKEYRRMIDMCIQGMLNEPVFKELHLIQQPILVLFGERDALIPNRLIHHVSTDRIAEQGTKKMPNAKAIVLPDCGHFLQWEKADEVNELIVGFVN